MQNETSFLTHTEEQRHAHNTHYTHCNTRYTLCYIYATGEQDINAEIIKSPVCYKRSMDIPLCSNPCTRAQHASLPQEQGARKIQASIEFIWTSGVYSSMYHFRAYNSSTIHSNASRCDQNTMQFFHLNLIMSQTTESADSIITSHPTQSFPPSSLQFASLRRSVTRTPLN